MLLAPPRQVVPHRAAWLCLAAVVALIACGRGGRTPPPGAAAPGAPSVQRTALNPTFDATPLYRQMGMIARGLPFPILGRAAFVASARPDTTHVIVALSFANVVLNFNREADNRFRASYTVAMSLARDNEVVERTETTEQVLVGSYRETSRSDESIIHQEILDVPPGRYTLSITIRDEGSQRAAQEELTLVVPRLRDGGVSTPMPITEVTPRTTREAVPAVLLSPSGTAVAGRDSVISVYVEAYGEGTTPLRLVVRGERGRELWNDTVTVSRQGGIAARIVQVPVARIGIGVAQLTFAQEGSADSASAYVFVGFGGDLPIATFDDMLSYLRYFAAPYRIQRLRDAPEEQRPGAWAEFVRATDAQPETSTHEDLRAYFGRMVRANGRFREEATPGWLSDRGRVFIALGEPDQLFEPQLNDLQRNRQQVWEYRSQNMQLVFYDQTGAGRWRLTQSSEVRFESEFRRRLK